MAQLTEHPTCVVLSHAPTRREIRAHGSASARQSGTTSTWTGRSARALAKKSQELPRRRKSTNAPAAPSEHTTATVAKRPQQSGRSKKTCAKVRRKPQVQKCAERSRSCSPKREQLSGRMRPRRARTPAAPPSPYQRPRTECRACTLSARRPCHKTIQRHVFGSSRKREPARRCHK